ncbi:MAG TPA: 50S ribosomal protein L4 [Pyrinomonadaceae bacterium]
MKVRNLKNEEIGEAELSEAVFGAELNESLIHSAVKAFLANARQGTVGTKTRGDVSGSGKKLWKQKGTGRARIASIRSPLWKGGGNVHGPQSRDWSQNLPKKMRRGALRSALSERLREGNIVVIDEFVLGAAKTKEFVSALAALGLEGKTLVVDTVDNENLLLASRNVKRAKVVGASGVNIYDVLYHEKLVFSRSAAESLSNLLDPKSKSDGKGEEEAEPQGDAQAEEEAA